MLTSIEPEKVGPKTANEPSSTALLARPLATPGLDWVSLTLVPLFLPRMRPGALSSLTQQLEARLRDDAARTAGAQQRRWLVLHQDVDDDGVGVEARHVEGQGVAGLQAERRGIDDEVVSGGVGPIRRHHIDIELAAQPVRDLVGAARRAVVQHDATGGALGQRGGERHDAA